MIRVLPSMVLGIHRNGRLEADVDFRFFLDTCSNTSEERDSVHNVPRSGSARGTFGEGIPILQT